MPHAHPPRHLDDLPRVLARLPRRLDHLVPLLGSPFGVAEDPLALHPRRRRQDQVGDRGRRCRVDFADDDEVAVARACGRSATIGSVTHGFVVWIHSVFMSPRSSARNMSTAWYPGVAGMVPAGSLQIRSASARCSGLVTTMSAGSRLLRCRPHAPCRMRSAARSGSAGWRRAGDLAGDQMDVGDEVVHPRPAHVLVDAHAPQADRAACLVAVDVRERAELLHRHAGDLAHALRGVIGEERPQLVERAGRG